MATETRTCQSCKTDFTIEPEDLSFYQKIDVPPPTWCPECRNMRRVAWREHRTLYHGSCALCKKETLSIHIPGGPFTVYCRECWISDRWDPMEYGREYDFTKPFFAQYRELMEQVPRPALTGTNMVNSEYAHASVSCKNCYYVFWSYFSQDSQYDHGLLLSRDTYDSYTTDNSDHAYETLHCNRLFRTSFAYFSDECLDSAMLYNCLGCSDCFGCVNLRKQKYCLWNEQLSKEEYTTKVKEWDLGSYSKLKEAQAKLEKLRLSLPHRYAHILNSINVEGDVIRDAKNCKECYAVLDGVENCKYIYFGGLNLKDSQDVSAGGDMAELLYETVGATRSSRCFFSAGCTNAKDVMYSDWSNLSDLFGCVGLKKKQYCILNRQYKREEYFVMIEKIKKHMDDMPYTDKKGRVYKYGEFFPSELSAYAYNESIAFLWYPKTKQEVLSEGWRWQEPPTRSYEVSKDPKDLPDHIRDVDDGILQEIIGCLHQGACNHECSTAFRLTPQELAFYRDMNLALPRLCPKCRFAERFAIRNGYRLWPRQCMCGRSKYANANSHAHGVESCSNEFKTTFEPDRVEIVYCEQCYKAEFL